MTFLNSLKKWFYTNNSSAAGSAARIPLLDAAGNAVGSDTYNAIAQVVRQELATILSGADQGTSGTKFPSIASGVLGSMTAANLASVLGGVTTQFVDDSSFNIDNFKTTRGVVYVSGTSSAPTSGGYGFLECVYYKTIRTGVDVGLQVWTDISTGERFYREYSTNAWGSWKDISTDIPSFYKDYTTPAELGFAVRSPHYVSVNITDYFDEPFQNSLLDSYASASPYTVWQGASGAGTEGFWSGTKHSAVGEALLMSRSGLFFITLTNNPVAISGVNRII